MDKHNGKRYVFAAANVPIGSSGHTSGDTIPDDHLEAINALQAERGKPALTADDVIVRPIRLVGNQVTAIYTRFYDPDIYLLASQMPGAPLLIGHDYASSPIGTFYKAEVNKDSDGLWLDGWFYLPNDEQGRQAASRIDSGVFNEASLGWKYTEAVCSVCGRDYFGAPDANGEVCTHWRGETYDGQVCYIYTTGDIEFLEGSVVFRGAHPGTNVGGYLAAAASKAGAIADSDVDAIKRGAIGKLYVPSNPPDYDIDDSSSWSAPTFSDFVSALGLDDSTTWSDLTVAQQRWVSKHYAYAPSNNPGSYVFSDLKLPHHVPNTYPKSTVVWGGVRAAAQRLASTDIPESEVSKVQAHLSKHYQEFDREAPWESAADTWRSYMAAAKKLASGFITDEVVSDARRLAKLLFAKEEDVDSIKLEVKFGEEVVAFDGDIESIQKDIQTKVDEFVGLMAKKVEELETKNAESASASDGANDDYLELQKEVETLKEMAALGEAYVKDLVDEVITLAIKVDGADNIDGYRKAIEALSAGGDIEALKVERDRLQSRVDNIPNGQLSVDDGGDGAIGDEVPPQVLDAYSQG